MPSPDLVTIWCGIDRKNNPDGGFYPMAQDDPAMRGKRSRNQTDGRLRDTRDDKHVGTLEKQYDRDFGVRSDMHVDTLLKQTSYSSVSKLINSGIGKKKK
jgi:hypothetical protein